MTTLPTTRIDSLIQNDDEDIIGSAGGDLQDDILLVDFIPNGGISSRIQGPQQHQHQPYLNVNSTSQQSPGVTEEGPLRVTSGGYPSSTNGAVIIPTSYNNHQNRPEYLRYNSNHSYGGGGVAGGLQDISNFTLVNLTNQQNGGDLGLGDGDLPEDPEEIEEQEELLEHQSQSQRFPSLKSKRNSFLTGGHPGSLLLNRRTSQSFQKVSSSLSSSSSQDDNSDTGFLVPQNSNGARDNLDKVTSSKIRRDPFHQFESPNTNNTPSYPGSPGFLQQSSNHRKRLRRRRPSRNKSAHHNRQEHQNNHSDVLSACCCLGDDELISPYQSRTSSSSSSLTSKYLRFSCFIVCIIGITTAASIIVSLQRKVDSLSAEVIKLGIDVAAGSSTLETSQSDQDIRKSLLLDLSNQEIQVNVSLSEIKSLIDELSQKVSKLEKQPSIEQVRQEEARLGTDLKGYIDELKREFESFKSERDEEQKKKLIMTSSNGGQGQGVLSRSKSKSSVPVTTPAKEPT